MTLLDVRDLSVRYEPKASRPLDAVQGVSFSIEPGEFVGLIGESGSGKTTLGTALLRLLQRPGRIRAVERTDQLERPFLPLVRTPRPDEPASR